jgi:uncharacterized integral membrane protein
MTTEPSDRAERRLTVSPKIVLAVVLGVLATVFVFQNTAKGQVNVFFWTVRMPAWIWLLGVFLVGVAVGRMLPWLRRKARQRG